MKTITRIALIAALTPAAIFIGVPLFEGADTHGMHASAPPAQPVCINNPRHSGTLIFSDDDQWPCPLDALGFIDTQGGYHLTGDSGARDLALVKLLKQKYAAEILVKDKK